MNSKQVTLPLALTAAVFHCGVWAQHAGANGSASASGSTGANSANNSALLLAEADLDVTMSVVEQGKGPEGVIQQIQLPPPASSTGTARSAPGIATANKVRGAGADSIGAVRDTVQGLNAEAGAAARDTVKDSISGGAIREVPGAVRDNLPAGGVTGNGGLLDGVNTNP
jgi:hypothetical protein